MDFSPRVFLFIGANLTPRAAWSKAWPRRRGAIRREFAAALSGLERGNRSGLVSRVLYARRPLPPWVAGAMTIRLRRRLPAASSGSLNARADLPQTRSFGLASGGVYRTAGSPAAVGALLPHHFTYRLCPRAIGCIFSVALSLGSPPPAVSRHLVRDARTFLPRSGDRRRSSQPLRFYYFR